MRKSLGMLVGLVLLATVSVGQDEAHEQKLNITTKGDTVYDFTIEVSVEPAIDQSSARKLVEGWLILTDDREATGKIGKAAMSKYDDLRDAELDTYETLLIADEGEEETPESEDESSFQSTRHPSEITDEAVQEDGSVLITTKQVRESRRRDKDGEWETSIRENHRRFRCVEQDGTWFIASVENGRLDEKASTEDKPVINWREDIRGVLAMYYEISDRKLTKPEIKTTTPSEAALSLNTLQEFAFDSHWQSMVIAAKGLGPLIDSLAADQYKEKIKKDIERRSKNNKPDDPAPEVLEVREDGEAAATVIFKLSDSKAESNDVVKVVKQGESWRVTEKGRLYDIGTDKETYEPRDEIYWRR